MPPKYTYFKAEEVVGLDPELVAKLDWARGRSGVPFRITSGLRSADQNTASDGVKDSAHLRGLAVDLASDQAQNRFLMVQALILVGFKRIGIYDRHIHTDVDLTLPNPCLWIGVSH